jgi:hypothetical protein
MSKQIRKKCKDKSEEIEEYRQVDTQVTLLVLSDTYSLNAVVKLCLAELAVMIS